MVYNNALLQSAIYATFRKSVVAEGMSTIKQAIHLLHSSNVVAHFQLNHNF
jgi:hypothetical protein